MKVPTIKEIRQQRDKYRLTQVECAKALDISDRQWRRYESGENLMSGPLWVYFLNRDIWPVDPKT